MIAVLRLVMAALVWAVVGNGAAVAQNCTATAVPVVFASVYSSDNPRTESGSGSIDVSCGGGTANQTVYLCLTLGAGSGLGLGGFNTRYLNGSAPPSYTLFANGNTALPVGTKVNLGSISLPDGSGSASYLLTGTIDWGAYATYANLQSTFAGDFLLSFGSQEGCAGTGGFSQITGFSVSGSVLPSCTVNASSMNFGSVAANIAQNVDATATITVNCPLNTSYDVTLGDGLWFANGLSGRRSMKNQGNSFLSYVLFENLERTAVWDGFTSIPGTGADETITVFGRIPTGQNNLAAGTYSDVVVVTVTY